MKREELKNHIDNFIRFIELDAVKSSKKEEDLVKLLDSISYGSHFTDFTFDDRAFEIFDRENQQIVREKIEKIFPEFGYYNVAEKLRKEIAESAVIIGDAIDDLVDIYQELKEVQWYWENTSIDNALWYFENNYRTHWEEHLRNLQNYLCNLRKT